MNNSELEQYKANYQRYLSIEPKMGPIPGSLVPYVFIMIFMSMFLIYVLLLVVIKVLLFLYLSNKQITASEFKRFITFRMLGITKAFIRHNNNV
jgi:hypothetical protein